MHEDMIMVNMEDPSYWREYFTTLDQTPLGRAYWRGMFDDKVVSEIMTLPGESINDSILRHQRELTAMLEALEQIKLPELEWLITRLRQELKL